MVIGNGMIATRFVAYQDDDRFVIFASGVSNSSVTNRDVFDREKQLIIQTRQAHPDKRFIYFSTCSIYDESLSYSPYVLHKLQMESLVANHKGGYTIFRVSNPVGKTSNKHTILNYLIDVICKQISFTVYSGAKRNLMDLDDMYKLCDGVLQQSLFSNAILNVANPNSYSILYIVKHIENHFLKKALYKTVEKSSVPHIDVADVLPLYERLHIRFDNDYLVHLLKKYYPLT